MLFAKICFRFCLAVCAVPVAAFADTVAVLSFDDLNSSFSFDAMDNLSPNGYVLNTQYQAFGAIFQDALVIDAINQLDSTQSPPHSGNNVLLGGFTGNILVTFPVPVSAVSGFFNHVSDLSFAAFGLVNESLGSVILSGDNTGSAATQNESASLTGAGISQLLISSDSIFTLDDLSFTIPDVQTNPSPVPEPASAALLFGGAIVFVVRARKTRA